MKQNLGLSEQEITILSDLIYRISESGILNDFYEDQAEQRVIWNLEAQLEKRGSHIFDKDYKRILQLARDQVRDKE